MSDKIKVISLFSSAGIGELRLPKERFDVVLANELIRQRAECYSFFYPKTKMICDDITKDTVKEEIIRVANQCHVEFLIATPPCQGVSSLGKNKKQRQFIEDERNYLILHTLEIIDQCDFDYVLIENVPRFIEMYFPFQNDLKKLEDILYVKYGEKYHIDVRVLNAKDYGIAQSRPRAIIKMWKKHLFWPWPAPEEEISLREAIGHLPSLEPGEDSGIPWHQAKKENERAVLAVRHTQPGKSAIYNPVYYPKKADGSRIKGFHNTYKRMVWDQPCPARTTYSGSLSSHNNVHPGHLMPDGTYSDPRVLTLLETFIVSSIPTDIQFPPQTTDSFIRTVIGEAIPPRLMERIVEKIGCHETKKERMASMEKEKWILYKHTSDFEMIKEIALIVKNQLGTVISNSQRYRMQEILEQMNLYRTRNAKKRPLDSMNHRINTLEFYMFGYEEKKEKRFIFSPLGNLFIKKIDDREALKKVFTAMLFAIQFTHPANNTPKDFQLYPFRLLLQLLMEERLNYRIYNSEYVALIPYIKTIDKEQYEALVHQLLHFRSLSKKEKLDLIMTDEHLHVKSLYEWQYYTQTLLKDIGILEGEEGIEWARLAHPQKSNSNSPTTYRKLTSGYVTIAHELQGFIRKMLEQYPHLRNLSD